MREKLCQWVAVIAMAWGGLAVVVQAQTCPAPNNGTLRITADPVTSLPPGTMKLFLFKPGSGRADALSAPTAAEWAPTADDRSILAAAQATGAMAIEFAKADGGTICTRPYAVTAADTDTPGGRVEGVPESAATRRYDSPEACASQAGPQWEGDLAKRRRRESGGFTVLVFLESATGGDANVCYYNRDHGVVGDPIYVGVFRKSLTWTGVRFEPCAIQSAAPNILQSSEKFPSVLQGAGEWELVTFLPRRCFNTAVDVSIVGSGQSGPVTQRYPLAQYDRYRGTVQAGVLFTPLHDGDFALRAEQGDTSKKFIYDRGPTNRGPEYIATLQLYAVLKYLPSLLGRGAYAGRDPLNDQSITDRLGAILGVGIKNPGKRFVAGLSFELIYGVSAVGVIDFARISELQDNVSTTEPFQGIAADIPTKLVWKHRTTFGLSLDLRYVATLFTGNR